MKFVIRNKNNNNKSWHDYTLIMPTISIGNVGQLSIDLLISSMKVHLLGSFLSDCVVPIVGMDAFNSQSNLLTTSLDVYENKEQKLLILQQRSPIIKSRQSLFIDNMMDWITKMNFKSLLIFTSTLACERIDSQLFGPQCRFVKSNNMEDLNTAQLSEILPELENRTNFASGDPGLSGMTPYIPGSGITKKLLEKCNEKKIPVLIFLRFSYEADNIPDAMELVHLANSYFNWIDLGKEKIKTPPSWTLFFGNQFDQIIFQ